MVKNSAIDVIEVLCKRKGTMAQRGDFVEESCINNKDYY